MLSRLDNSYKLVTGKHRVGRVYISLCVLYIVHRLSHHVEVSMSVSATWLLGLVAYYWYEKTRIYDRR